MTQNNRLDHEIMLMEYAAGTLDEGLSLVAASYVTLSPQARHYVEHCETIAGTLIDRCCAPVEMGRSSLNNVLERLDTLQESPKPATLNMTGDDSIAARACPLPLQNHIATLCAEKGLEWKTIHPGVRICNIPLHNSCCKARIMEISPGVKTPAHKHMGQECTLILAGGMRDEYGRYDKGDLLILGGNTIHQPHADHIEGCLCLVTTEGPLKPVNWATRLTQIIWRF